MRYVHPDQTDVLDIASAVQQARGKSSGVATIFATVKQSKTEEVRKM